MSHLGPLDYLDKELLKKQPVTIFSKMNKHELVSVDTRYHTNFIKPKCVVDYNENMGIVDKSVMMISFNGFTRKTIK